MSSLIWIILPINAWQVDIKKRIASGAGDQGLRKVPGVCQWADKTAPVKGVPEIDYPPHVNPNHLLPTGLEQLRLGAQEKCPFLYQTPKGKQRV